MFSIRLHHVAVVVAFVFIVVFCAQSSVDAQVQDIPPAPGSNLRASLRGSTSIRLTWDDNTRIETGYDVQRSIDDPSKGGRALFVTIAQLPVDARSYDDSERSPGARYFYRVRARNDSGTSAWSNVDSALISPTTAPSSAPSTPVPSELPGRNESEAIPARALLVGKGLAVRNSDQVEDRIVDGAVFLFHRGEVFDVDDDISVRSVGVIFGAFGDPSLPDPILRWTGSTTEHSSIFRVRGDRTTIKNLSFDSESEALVRAVTDNSTGLVFRNNTMTTGRVDRMCVLGEAGSRSKSTRIEGNRAIVPSYAIYAEVIEDVLIRENDLQSLASSAVRIQRYSGTNNRVVSNILTKKKSENLRASLRIHCSTNQTDRLVAAGNRCVEGQVKLGPIEVMKPSTTCYGLLFEQNVVERSDQFQIYHRCYDLVIRANRIDARQNSVIKIQVNTSGSDAPSGLIEGNSTTGESRFITGDKSKLRFRAGEVQFPNLHNGQKVN